MNGSTFPPHAFFEYMPEHTCRFESFWFYCEFVQLLSLLDCGYRDSTYHQLLSCLRSS
jgi:hypothetical protein